MRVTPKSPTPSSASCAMAVLLRRKRDFKFVCPSPKAQCAQYVTNQKDYTLVWDVFDAAMKRELGLLLDAVPAEDLCIQWDAACETVAARREMRASAIIRERSGRPMARRSIVFATRWRVCHRQFPTTCGWVSTCVTARWGTSSPWNSPTCRSTWSWPTCAPGTYGSPPGLHPYAGVG